jgi:hypothetical protein
VVVPKPHVLAAFQFCLVYAVTDVVLWSKFVLDRDLRCQHARLLCQAQCVLFLKVGTQMVAVLLLVQLLLSREHPKLPREVTLVVAPVGVVFAFNLQPVLAEQDRLFVRVEGLNRPRVARYRWAVAPVEQVLQGTFCCQVAVQAAFTSMQALSNSTEVML